MIVIGIDLGGPGGLSVLQPNGDMGKVLHWQQLPKGLTLAGLRERIARVLDTFDVQVIATERPGAWANKRIGMAQREKQSVVKTLCQEHHIRLVEYQPQTIKKAVTGSGRATKEQVGRAVRRMVRIETTDEHVLDSVAIGLVALGREG